jgi:hypothetical protein
MAPNRERVALVSFITGSVLAGGNAVGVRFSNRELAPLWGAGLRFLAAAALLVAVMATLRQPPPRGRALTGALLYGLFNFGGAFALAYYGLVRVHAGLGQTLLALVPLATLLLAVVQRQERLRVAAVVGTLLALAGIAVMSQAPLQGSVPLLSLLAIVGGGAGAPVPQRPPGGHERGGHDRGWGAAGRRVDARRRAAGPAPTRRDVGCARLSRRRWLGGGVRALHRRAPLLERVPSGVHLRAHPGRHRGAVLVVGR